MKDEYSFNFKVSTLTKILIWAGLAAIAVSSISYGNYENYVGVVAVKKIIEIIGTTAFSAGLVSIVVEISTISGIVDKAFSRLLNGDFPVDKISKENQKKMKMKIVSEDTKIPVDRLKNTIYRYEEELEKLARSVFYEYHNITYYITPDEKQACFHINATVDFKIVNKYDNDDDNKFRLRMKLFKENSNMTEDECISILNFKKLKIGGKDINPAECIHVESIEHKTESRYYDYKLILEKDLGNTKANKIVAEYSYNIPIFDTRQSFRIGRPCKNVTHKIFIKPDVSNGEKWTISADVFSAFCCKQDDDNSNFSVEQGTDEMITITYKDWALVGNGYTVMYKKVI